MTYVIALPCVDVKDRACVDECPDDCIYEGQRSLTIHPDDCVDCGACEPVCPVEAIFYEDDVPPEWKDYTQVNAEFFDELGSPGGAASLGVIEADHPLIAALPPQQAQGGVIAVAGAGERPRRAEVLVALREADAPLGVADVAGQTGVHVNTARFHLDALVAEGAVVRTVEQPSGPGRPRTVYAPRPGMDRAGIRSYRLLAQILLSHLSSAGPDAGEAARQAGRAWGRFLVGRLPPFQQLTGEEATARLTDLLADLGFAPEPEAGTPAPGVIPAAALPVPRAGRGIRAARLPRSPRLDARSAGRVARAGDRR